MNAKRFLALLLTLVLAAGCALADAADDDPVLADMGGEPIRLSDVEGTYAYLLDLYSYYGYDMTTEENMAFARSTAMQQVVQERLVLRYAAEHGLDQFTEADLAELDAQNEEIWAQAVEDYVNYYATEADLADENRLAVLREDAVAHYEGNGDTRETTLASLKQNALTERVQAALAAGAAVSEEDILAEYDRLVADDMMYMTDPGAYEFYLYFYGYEPVYIPAGFRSVLNLLVKPDEETLEAYMALNALWEEQVNGLETEGGETADNPVTEEQLEEARLAVIASVQPTLDAIAAELESGVAFEEVMAKYGADTGMQEEPARSEGCLVSEDSIIYDTAFVNAAFSMSAPGEVSAPAVGSDGVYILYYLGDVPEGAVELTDEMRASIEEQLLDALETDLFNTAVAGWMEEAQITYTEQGEPWRIMEDADITVVDEDE